MKILQIGESNWQNELMKFPEDLEWFFTIPSQIEAFLMSEREKQLEQLSVAFQENPEEIPPVRIKFDAILITSVVQETQLNVLMNTIEAYGLYHTASVRLESETDDGIFRRKMLRELPIDGTNEEIIWFMYSNLFGGQYGAKLKIPDIDVNPQFAGKIKHNGHVSTSFEGEFGEDFRPLFTFRYNLSSFPTALELWLEYVKVIGDVTIRLEIVPMQKGSLYTLLDSIIFDEPDMQEPVVIPANDSVGFYSILVHAKGQGKIDFGPLHWRYSRTGLGRFVLGGDRYNDDKRQEFIYYFNPGDMKPPMNVYFSGYRTAEGFEGYGIMSSLKAPFMLIGDPRIEGGGFYIGTPELENQIQEVIQAHLDYLKFDSSDLILSGLSMGTYGALYYAAHFNPYAVVVGKPFTNLGDTAAGMKLKRPGEFETIGDILMNVTGGVEEVHLTQLNEKFWNKFDKATFDNTKFAIAYMKQDDYDSSATAHLIEHLSNKNAHIYSKGYEGRHNDNSRSINKWFMKQYVDLLKEGYKRKYE